MNSAFICFVISNILLILSSVAEGWHRSSRSNTKHLKNSHEPSLMDFLQINFPCKNKKNIKVSLCDLLNNYKDKSINEDSVGAILISQKPTFVIKQQVTAELQIPIDNQNCGKSKHHNHKHKPKLPKLPEQVNEIIEEEVDKKEFYKTGNPSEEIIEEVKEPERETASTESEQIIEEVKEPEIVPPKSEEIVEEVKEPEIVPPKSEEIVEEVKEPERETASTESEQIIEEVKEPERETASTESEQIIEEVKEPEIVPPKSEEIVEEVKEPEIVPPKSEEIVEEVKEPERETASTESEQTIEEVKEPEIETASPESEQIIEEVKEPEKEIVSIESTEKPIDYVDSDSRASPEVQEATNIPSKEEIKSDEDYKSGSLIKEEEEVLEHENKAEEVKEDVENYDDVITDEHEKCGCRGKDVLDYDAPDVGTSVQVAATKVEQPESKEETKFVTPPTAVTPCEDKLLGIVNKIAPRMAKKLKRKYSKLEAKGSRRMAGNPFDPNFLSDLQKMAEVSTPTDIAKIAKPVQPLKVSDIKN